MINMNNFVILPILVPPLAAVPLIFMNRRVMLMRIFSTAASCVSIAISAALVQTVFTHGIQTLTLGGWKAPYGIVLAADQLAALLVLTTAIIGSLRHPVLLPLHRRKKGARFLLFRGAVSSGRRKRSVFDG